MFDVRCLPNPHYDPKLRPLTGKDQPVIDFLEKIPEVGRMDHDIYNYVATWLPSYIRDNRSYLTIAIGCTGASIGRCISPKPWQGNSAARRGCW